MDISRGQVRALAIGGAVALAGGLFVAAIMAARQHGPNAPPPASQGGLRVQTGRDDDIKLDPKRPLRCFVAGRLIGELPLSDCARRNGVATGALDVGLDASGALAASNGVSSDLTPLPPGPREIAGAAPAAEPARDASEPAPQAGASQRATAACWRYANAVWWKLPDMTLGACVQNLYAGQCERQGSASYGRWGDRTLRRMPGRIEISGDNRSFRTLADQGQTCSIGPISPALSGL
jgi:hypothetical protein